MVKDFIVFSMSKATTQPGVRPSPQRPLFKQAPCGGHRDCCKAQHLPEWQVYLIADTSLHSLCQPKGNLD